jgi:hypothetical protein
LAIYEDSKDDSRIVEYDEKFEMREGKCFNLKGSVGRIARRMSNCKIVSFSLWLEHLMMMAVRENNYSM